MSIRKYEERDKEKVRGICLTNAHVSPADKKTAEFILLMFCDYYIEQEPENCFVAVDEDDEPVGYIYGAFDYDRYHETFMTQYYPRLKAVSLRRAVEAKIEMRDHAVYKEDYPAHFHIDVLSAHQSGGVGSMLLSNFCDNLTQRAARGVMMICGRDNIGAQKFYKKNGMEVLHSKRTGVAMGKKLK